MFRVQNRIKSLFRFRGVAWRLVKSCPGLGEIRTAQLLPIVVTPYRFKNKRAFWAYCGRPRRSSAMPSSADPD